MKSKLVLKLLHTDLRQNFDLILQRLILIQSKRLGEQNIFIDFGRYV